MRVWGQRPGQPGGSALIVWEGERMAHRTRIALLLLLLLVAVAGFVAGCSHPKPPAHLTPLVQPPAVRDPGTLRVGVNPSYPPFVGDVAAEKTGIDIDVAEALAARLGLTAEFVDVDPSQIATALAKNDVDLVMSAPFSADVLSRATIASTYLSDGPALFGNGGPASGVDTQSVVASGSAMIGAQTGSPAYWQVLAECGSGRVVTYSALRDAFGGLARGDVSYVAGDAVVGAYIARDYSSAKFVGSLAPANLLGIAVDADNVKLEEAVGRNMDRMAADGVLDTIRSKWVGSLPKLPLQGSDTSGSTDNTATAP
jgi:ABC-type amino acid transport substrate-binding protein